MYLRALTLTNIRGFADLKLDFTDEKGGARLWTTIIGKNGTGKTSLLRSIAIGLASIPDANAMLAAPVGPLVSAGRKYGSIELELMPSRNSKKILTTHTTVKKQRSSERIRREGGYEEDDSVAGFVVAYGVGRTRLGRGQFRSYRILDSTETLFQYNAELTPPELTVRRLRDYLGQEIYTQALTGIFRAFDLPSDTKLELGQGGGLYVSGETIGARIPLEGLADGYRLNFAWIFDFYGWALQAGALTKNGGIKGILLIDELEQHTHPSIQMGLVPRLKMLWPQLQVVAATHSPLVMLGCEAEEVVVFMRKGNTIIAGDGGQALSGYSVEDALVDERLFDTEPCRPETREARADYEQFVAIPVEKRSAAETKKLQLLSRGLRPKGRGAARPSPLVQELQALRKKYDL